MRAGDSDRERVLEVVRQAHADGRLSTPEFYERLDSVYLAKTYAELDELVRDLPAPGALAPSFAHAPLATTAAPPGAVAQPSGMPRQIWALWGTWATAVCINVVIWLIIAVASLGDDDSAPPFWPIWVAGPWGIVQRGNHAHVVGQPEDRSRSTGVAAGLSDRTGDCGVERKAARGVDSSVGCQPALEASTAARSWCFPRAGRMLVGATRQTAKRPPDPLLGCDSSRRVEHTRDTPQHEEMRRTVAKKEGAIEIEGTVVEALPNAIVPGRARQRAQGSRAHQREDAPCTTSGSFPRTGSWWSSARTT